jgi:peptidoglycan-associated lipoprotein
MMKIRNVSVLALILMILVILPQACRSRTRRQPVTPAPVVVTDTAPMDVPMVVPTDTADFVRDPEPTVTSEMLPAAIEEVNVIAQQRGWIRDVFFDYDSSALSPDGQDALAVTASWLRSQPEYGLLIEGHCDERGTEQYNLALGDRRANIARDYLATLGVPDGRMRTVSYGEERPFAKGSNEGAWRQNRRAHLVLVRP